MSDTNLEENESNLKPIFSDMGILSRSDGSAIFCQGDTVMMASIHGPSEAKLQNMLIDKAYVNAHFRPKAGVPSVDDRANESFIRNTIASCIMANLYPRTEISVIVQELQNSGGLLSCAINSSYLAMLDAGIEMQFMVAAVTCIIDEKGNFILEPNHLEIEKAKAIFHIAFNSSDGNVCTSSTKGIFSKGEYMDAVRLCRKASSRIFAHYKEIIKSKIIQR